LKEKSGKKKTTIQYIDIGKGNQRAHRPREKRQANRPPIFKKRSQDRSIVPSQREKEKTPSSPSAKRRRAEHFPPAKKKGGNSSLIPETEP